MGGVTGGFDGFLNPPDLAISPYLTIRVVLKTSMLESARSHPLNRLSCMRRPFCENFIKIGKFLDPGF